MPKTKSQRTCQQCGARNTVKFCSNSGQSLSVKRLTTSNILNEVFHFFTNLDKGFPYTFKKLALALGKTQKDYIDGHRNRYQPPFSMYFICGPLTALALYSIHRPIGNISHFDEVQGHFTRHYYVIVQLVLLPFYALVTWLFFKNTKINYAESLVLLAYAYRLCFYWLFLLTSSIYFPIKTLPHPYYEIPVLFLYLFWTYINFFREEPKWRVLLKTGITILIFYLASNLASNLIVSWML